MRISLSVLLLALLSSPESVLAADARMENPEFTYTLSTGSMDFSRKRTIVNVGSSTGPTIRIRPELEWQHEFIQFGATSQFSQYMDIDFRLGFGAGDTASGFDESGEIETMERRPKILFNVYGKFFDHDWKTFRPYFLVGLSHTFAETNDEPGTALGAGLQYAVSETIWLTAEYNQFVDTPDHEAKGFTLGVLSYY